jgi:hypothetical protein
MPILIILMIPVKINIPKYIFACIDKLNISISILNKIYKINIFILFTQICYNIKVYNKKLIAIAA